MPKTQFLKCAHRAKAYGAAWLARTELLARQRLSEDKNALEYASFHILTESIRLGATALKAVDDSILGEPHQWLRAQREKEGRSRSGRE